MSLTLDEYRDEVDRLILERRSETIGNGTQAHAAVIVERMFKFASDHMRILTRGFDPQIYGQPELLDAAEPFLANPDARVDVIVEEWQEGYVEHHPFLERFGGRANLRVRTMEPEIADIVGLNFSVMDDYGARVEHEPRSVKAVASFGDVPFAQSLIWHFDDLAEKHTRPVDLTPRTAAPAWALKRRVGCAGGCGPDRPDRHCPLSRLHSPSGVPISS